MASSDTLLPGSGDGRLGLNRGLIVAFVPITLALIGVGAVLFGGISARTAGPEAVAATAIDPETTGSIAPIPGGWLRPADTLNR